MIKLHVLNISKYLMEIKIIVQTLMAPPTPVIYYTTIDDNYTFYDLLLFLQSLKSNKIPYGDSSFKHNGEFIRASKLNQKIADVVVDNALKIYEYGIFTPKNSFLKIKNIIRLRKHNLEDTINIDHECIINHAKIGEWIGWGRGPTTVPKTEDNTLPNLLFIRYPNTKPYVYNIHCLYELINKKSNTLLIPHINKHISAHKFRQIYTSCEAFKILILTSRDIVC